MNRAIVISLALLSIVQAIGTPAIAAAVETCTSSGVTYNCITEEVAERQIRAGYLGAGNGTIDSATVQQEWARWPDNTSNFGPLPGGIALSAALETPIRVAPANNGTAYINPTWPVFIHAGNVTGQYIVAYTFNVQLNASVGGSGYSEWYYRSPVLWRDDLFQGHAVVMSDPAGVIASEGCGPPAVTTLDCDIVGDRIFYHFQGIFPTGHNVTITEYVKPLTAGPQVIDFLDVYASLYQDIDGNGREVDFFPASGSSELPTHDFDLGYSFRFVIGSHPSESFLTVRSNNTLPHHSLRFFVTNPVSDASVNQLQFILPMRTTTPLNVSLTVIALNASSTTIGPISIPNVTQNVAIDLGMAGAVWSSGDNHTFRVQLDFWFNDTDNVTNWVFIPMERDDSSTFEQIDSGTSLTGLHFYNVRPWAEVRESIRTGAAPPTNPMESTGTPETRDFSDRLLEFLIGVVALGAAAGLGALAVVTAGASFGIAIPLSVGIGAAAAGAGAVSGRLIGDALFEPDGHGIFSARLRSDAEKVGDALKDAAAIAACGGALLVKGTLAKVALGGACALLVGSIASGLPLLDIVLKLAEIVKRAIEEVGHFLQEALQIAAWAAELLFPILGLLAYAYVVLVPLKLVLLAVGGVVGAVETKGGDPRRSPTFIFIRDTFYLPGWSELVEEKLGLFHAKAAPQKLRKSRKLRRGVA